MTSQIASIDSVEEKTQVFTYADLIIDYLLKIDVEYIFGVPGGAIEPLYNAIARNLRSEKDVIQHSTSLKSILPIRKRSTTRQIKAIVARHEAGAAFMADGYTRETGRLGVCCATTGPGATNLITGVASAYADRIPMLVITPQTALPNFGKNGLQESSSDAVDIVGMFEHCTRYNSLISHPNQLEGKLYTALLNAFRRPRGPVHLSIPMDILNTQVKSRLNSYHIAHLFRQPKSIDEDAYQALVNAIDANEKCVLFLGGGCNHAMESILKFAEETNTQIVTTPAGKSLIDAYHPLYRGVFGFAGHESAYNAIADDVDIIIAVGTSLGELSTCGWDDCLMNNKLIHIAVTPDDFARSPMACLHLMGGIQPIFLRLCEESVIRKKRKKLQIPNSEDEVSNQTIDNYVPDRIKLQSSEQMYSDNIPLKPQRVMRELASHFPEDTRYIVDAGNAWSWATHYLLLGKQGIQRAGFGFGSMAWAIGASIGTSLGNQNKPVVCITGDGSYLMSGQEITVAVQQRLPVIFVVLNDQALGMVKHGQRLSGAEQIGYELPPVDFAQIARAMGAQAYSIHHPDDFKMLSTKELFLASGPTLIDIYIDPEEIPPIGSRVKTLNS